MRQLLLTAILSLAFCLQAKAQVFIVNDNITNGRMSEISASVVDSLSNEPIAYASFYVIPAKDTTISNFTLTDAEGKAKLEEVPYGDYVLHVEMLGYKPFTKQRYFRDRRVDMGTIKLRIDENYLKAATVTDVGNPIVVKKDTVEFNASSFQVGTNSMLKDLLKRMPGMEITEEQSPDDRHENYREKISGVGFLSVHIILNNYREYNNLWRHCLNYFL